MKMNKMISSCNDKIKFYNIKSTKEHIKLTYEFLLHRKSSISHKVIPSLEEHKKFVSNHPYRCWFFIEVNNKKKGTIYIHKDNSIGLYLTDINANLIYDIFKTIKDNFDPLPGIKSIRNENFIINIPYDDIKLEKAIKSIGSEPIQKTFLI